MKKEELFTFIKRHAESDDFTGGVSEEQIDHIQVTLGVQLPESYKWFLINFGSGGLFGVDISGVGKSNIAAVINDTERYRSLGIGKNLVVVEDSGEYAYCLHTGKMENNECPVIAYNRIGGLDDYSTANNFLEFLAQRLLDAKESWDEGF